MRLRRDRHRRAAAARDNQTNDGKCGFPFEQKKNFVQHGTLKLHLQRRRIHRDTVISRPSVATMYAA
jgi:hypothetical protein